jgi:hypothetical protein
VKELHQRYLDLKFSMIESLLHMRSDLEKKVFKKCIEEIKSIFMSDEKIPNNDPSNEKSTNTNSSQMERSSVSLFEDALRKGMISRRKLPVCCVCDFHYFDFWFDVSYLGLFESIASKPKFISLLKKDHKMKEKAKKKVQQQSPQQ